MNPQEPAGKAEPTAREPPARAIVLVGDKPHQYVEVAFPWELNNTDYLRRVLGQVTLSLRPLYLDAVKSGACAKVRTGDNYEVGASQADAFYILKHILENLHHYAEVLGMSEDDVHEAAMCLRSARNRLAHEEDDLQGCSWQDLSSAFISAEALAAAARCRFAVTNLTRIKRQCEEHQESKEMRQQGQATRVACSSISESSAIESARKPNSAASEFRLSRQWWMDEKNEWGLGHLMAPVQRQGASRAVADWRPRILSRADLSGAQQPAADSRSGFHVTNVPSIMKRRPSQPNSHVQSTSRRREEQRSPFLDMNLQGALHKGILASGLHEPSAVQKQAIGALIRGQDVVMAARHGSGRTSAACIGVLSRLKLSEGTCQALILTPSREEGELAQVVLSTVGDGTSATSHACGSDSKADLQALEQGAQVVLGTPAHVKDLLKQHALQPRSVKMVVMEDVDELLMGGFKDNIYDVFHLLQPPKLLTRKSSAASSASSSSQVQVVATCTSMPPQVTELIQRFTKDPVQINLIDGSSRGTSQSPAAQFYLAAQHADERLECLRCCHRLLERSAAQGVVFVNTRDEADWISCELQGRHGIVVTLAQLLDAEQFSSVSSRLLVASDEDSAVVQKALSMLLVINYDLPETPEHYMQRIKCCKGASAAGLNLISSRDDERMLQHVEHLFNMSVNKLPSNFLTMV